MKQLPLDIIPPPPTLSNFVPGRNVELLQTLDNILTARAQERFVYLWGGTGCGKSHLLQGVASACKRNDMNPFYFACGERTSFANGSEADCVMVDDVDRLGADAQIGLFHLYNRIRDEGQAFLLVSGSVAPAQLKLREDLRTRLVLLVEFDIAGLMNFAVEHSLLDQVLSPLEVAIACEQGIIEVKQSEVHETGCNSSRTSGTVIFR